MRRLWLITVVIVAAGCTGNPTVSQDDNPLPRLDEIRSSRTVIHDTPATSIPWIDLRLLTIPQNVELQDVWALTTTEGLPQAMLASSADNGFRVGILPRESIDEFIAGTGGVFSVATRQFNPPKTQVSMELSGLPHRTHTLRTYQPGKILTQGNVPVGKYQITLITQRSDESEVTLRLTPHLHFAQPSVIPRLPQTKDLDGRLFVDQAFDVTIRTEWFVVIGKIEPETPADTAETVAEQTLGLRMFSAIHHGRPAKVLLLLGLVNEAARQMTD